jgi:hypothetical protein
VEGNAVAVRKRGNEDLGAMTIEAFAELLNNDISAMGSRSE